MPHAVPHAVPLVLTRPVGASFVVAAVCPEAHRRGLRPGLSLGQAQAMVPELVAWPEAPLRDRALLRRLARWAEHFSPTVEAVEPDMLVIDITGCQLLFGGEENIARQVVAGLSRLGHWARAAVADTVGAAWALASTPLHLGSPLRKEADSTPTHHYGSANSHSRSACHLFQPARRGTVTIVPPGAACAWLAPLPPVALRIEPAAAEQLDRVGVRTIGDLLLLPRCTLPARFGPGLVLRIQQALGEVFEPVTPQRPDDRPVARRAFEEPLTDPVAVQAVAGELLGDVLDQVRQHGRALRRLEVVLTFERVAPQRVLVSLARGSCSAQHVGPLLAGRLEGVDVSPGVAGLVLIGRETSPHRAGQGELFEPSGPGDDERLAELVDRLAGRLGYEAVVRPRLVDDYQPEMAFRYLSVAEAGCESDDTPSTAGPVNNRPVRLLERPLPIRALALVPDGPPTWVAWGGREHVVVRARGPERIETAWWRGRDVRRDYFRVMTAEGEEFWVFRARDDGRWFVHGLFA